MVQRSAPLGRHLRNEAAATKFVENRKHDAKATSCFTSTGSIQGRSTADPEGRPLVTQEDVGSLTQEFKKSYIDEKYGVEEAEKKYAEWDKLMQQLFIRRK